MANDKRMQCRPYLQWNSTNSPGFLPHSWMWCKWGSVGFGKMLSSSALYIKTRTAVLSYNAVVIQIYYPTQSPYKRLMVPKAQNIYQAHTQRFSFPTKHTYMYTFMNLFGTLSRIENWQRRVAVSIFLARIARAGNRAVEVVSRRGLQYRYSTYNVYLYMGAREKRALAKHWLWL